MSKKAMVGGGVNGVATSPTNAAKDDIESCAPYTVTFTIKGVSDMLFHRWNCESIEEKSKAAKGSKAKKEDNVESYVYRDDNGNICLPGEYVRQAVISAAKYRQDPRSPRKSAMDLFKAAIVSLTEKASLGAKEWDFEHKCRVQVQRNGITRVRPAFKAGWQATLQFMCNIPEYISPEVLHEVLNNAGRLVGVADFRPTFGRFLVTSFAVDLE